MYVDNVQMAGKSLISKKSSDGSIDVDYVFIAEPILTNCLKQNTDASIYYNIQDLYYKKTNSNLIQAGLFIKNSVNKSNCVCVKSTNSLSILTVLFNFLL